MGLDALGELIGPRFFRREPRVRALAYVKALLSQVETRNGWTVAEAAGEKTPTGMQRLLNDAVWDEAGVREDLRSYVVTHLGADDGVLVFDETGDIKQGNHTVGVARQYTGVTGQVENCQVSVHAGYVSSRGQALIDTELYLPDAYAHDSERCAEAGVPAERAGVVITKGDLAAVMFGRAVAAGMPFSYVAGDEVYGRSTNLRSAIETTGAAATCWRWAATCGSVTYPAQAPGRRPARRGSPLGLGTPQPRPWHERAAPPRLGLDRPGLPRLPSRVATQPADPPRPRRHRRRRASRKNRRKKEEKGGTRRVTEPASGEQYAYFLCYHRLGTTLGELIHVAGRRWGIEESFAITKSETGLDEHQVRRWRAWYRHAILSMLAAAFLAAIAPASQQTPPPGRRADPVHLQRDPPATGNDPSVPRSRDPLRPPLVRLATTPPSPRRTVPLPATRRTARPPQPPHDHDRH